jgi:hypothetical protein
MSYRHLIKYSLSLPPHIAVAKILGIAKKRILGLWLAKTRALEETFTESTSISLDSLKRSIEKTHISEQLTAATQKALTHEFDLLGSGWTNVDQDQDQTNERNLCSAGNFKRSKKIRLIMGPNYKPIDWHLDFKSGFHWSPLSRSESIQYGHEPGVDIKVPWELARLQHLPQLALAYPNSIKQNLIDEFQNQALDFISANPPRFGVNWVCTMDIAIRAANLILSFDLFRAKGAVLSPPFTDEFVAAIQAHGTQIINNLEWYPNFRGNHYLSNITGLLFVASFLPRDPNTDCWLAFAVQEFVLECKNQFHPDGSNIEASTNYHRLSAEMVVYGTALILGLDDDKQAALNSYDHTLWHANPKLAPAPIEWVENLGPFSQAHFSNLRKIAQFSIDITKPDGHVVQIGDTDNGRFFKLYPAINEETLAEDLQNHRHLAAAIGGLLGDAALITYAGDYYAQEAIIVADLKGSTKLLNYQQSQQPFIPIVKAIPIITKDICKESSRLIIKLPSADLTSKLTSIAYPDFGLYIWKSTNFFLSVRCGTIGQNGNGGHAHNDQLAIELQINEVDWIADPGTYTYTANTKIRDQYRSHLAHATPRVNLKEPSRLDLGLFRLEDNAHAHSINFNEHEFLGVHYGYRTPTYRRITLHTNYIEIIDSLGVHCPHDAHPPATIVSTPEQLRLYFGITLPFSPGYGLQI